jgi:hypothetical protein
MIHISRSHGELQAVLRDRAKKVSHYAALILHAEQQFQ